MEYSTANVRPKSVNPHYLCRMIRETDLILNPFQAAFEKEFLNIASKKLAISPKEITSHRLLQKSLDARQRDIKIHLKLRLWINEPADESPDVPVKQNNVSNATEVLIVGAGPAGLFAALKLIEFGLKPIILERGKEVSERKKDIAELNSKHILNPDSNYCYGEGGAGTFSDGKLYTRSVKRGNVNEILRIFNHFDADHNILYEAHPHIGSDKLPAIIKNIRQYILDSGGEIHFGKKVTGLIKTTKAAKGLSCSDGTTYKAKAVILATGHSAADIYEMLSAEKLLLEPKPFAMGVRVEHPQELINQIQYHHPKHMDYLPPATYQLVTQAEGRGVFSFCMCPGGFIVPSATEEQAIVVNGMSPSHRNSPFANSGIVVEIRPEDYAEFSNFGPLAGLKYQQSLEKTAWEQGGFGQVAPAQRLTDFVNNKASKHMNKASYIPGFRSSPIHEWLPESIRIRLQQAFKDFDKKMKGFLTNQAMIFGAESRTSSPIRIPRDKNHGQHPQLSALFPCGEGAGFSGGIVSSAIDGMNCANYVKLFLNP
jgi:uncharacterized protein